ncbi:phage tail sheath C-terminal domain-containing protein [Denitromonas halophila]|uniref:Phage tail protein n=1 Tax=Denitromonas halophila TaxID=1629404 RepID=A0A557QX84_9RHOO|nr:phage tail sheath C-terminal domain-containing protein [Denitromonas halophila]TVO57525.1 phage tail protein [Denitromonas halophila]
MASPNISFDQIPSSIRKPGKYFEFNTKLAVRTLPGNRQETLIVAQKLAAGSQAAGVAVEVFGDDEAAEYFGEGSIAHLMVRAALVANPYLALSVIAMDDAVGSAAATGTITLAGTATSTGVLTVWIAGMRTELAIASGDTAADVAAAMEAKLDALGDLPVTASVAGAVITPTARNKGTLGNGIAVTATSTAAGITATTVAMSGGSVDPDIATPLAAVFAGGHDVIISSLNDSTSLTALRTHLDNVSGPLEQRGAIGVCAHVGTLAQATTLAGTINMGRISEILVPACANPSFAVAASYGAVVAGEEDPARPLDDLPLTGILAPPLEDRMSRTEQESSLYNGVTPTEVGPGEKVQIVRAITTYTLNPQSIPDISLLDLTTIRTLDYVRKACRERISLRFPREKLSSRTPDKVRGEIIDVLYKLEELEIVENVTENLPGVICERDSQDPNRLNCKIPVDVVNGLHVFAGRIDLLL